MRFLGKAILVGVLCLVPITARGGDSPAPLTNEDILTMHQAQMAPEVLLTAIRTQATDFDLSVDELVALRERGIPEEVLSAMLEASAPHAADESDEEGAQKVVLPDATEVRLRLVQTLSSASAQVGDPVRFEVVEDVPVDGITVIPEGARAHGTIILTKKKGSFGRRGKLDFSIDYVEAIDGQRVSLRALKSVKGKEKYATAGVVTYLTGPFGFFVKGKDVTLSAGEEYALFIDGDRALEVKVRR